MGARRKFSRGGGQTHPHFKSRPFFGEPKAQSKNVAFLLRLILLGICGKAAYDVTFLKFQGGKCPLVPSAGAHAHWWRNTILLNYVHTCTGTYCTLLNYVLRIYIHDCINDTELIKKRCQQMPSLPEKMCILIFVFNLYTVLLPPLPVSVTLWRNFEASAEWRHNSLKF